MESRLLDSLSEFIIRDELILAHYNFKKILFVTVYLYLDKKSKLLFFAFQALYSLCAGCWFTLIQN